MTYDNWKCTDPNDQWLGEEPMSDEDVAAMHKTYADLHAILNRAHERFNDGEMSLGDLGEIYLDSGYHPYQVRKILSKCVHYPIPSGYFGREE